MRPLDMQPPLGGSDGCQADTAWPRFTLAQEDIFYHDFQDLGDIPEVEIEHDNSGPGPAWHCQEVVVYDMTNNNKRYAYPCDR